jgi:hypothetical protein
MTMANGHSQSIYAADNQSSISRPLAGLSLGALGPRERISWDRSFRAAKIKPMGMLLNIAP